MKSKLADLILSLKRLGGCLIALLAIAGIVYAVFFGDFLSSSLGSTLMGIEVKNWDAVARSQDTVMLVVYWKIDCPNCQMLLDELNMLDQASRAQGFPMTIVAANMSDDAVRIREYAMQKELSMPILMNAIPKGLSGSIGLPFTRVYMKMASGGSWELIEQLQWYGYTVSAETIFNSIISYIQMMEGQQ